jgi:hypothetical protein
MTSLRQIEANRRNALKSTGPQTENGKRNSRQNAVRHGLTAETVVIGIEDISDYKGFEEAVILDYDAQSAVERELVLRLASLLWRLRRATAIETSRLQLARDTNEPELAELDDVIGDFATVGRSQEQIAGCFLRVADLENGVFDRLNRYEAALWRQVGQTLFTLEDLERRKPQERGARIGRSIWRDTSVCP